MKDRTPLIVIGIALVAFATVMLLPRSVSATTKYVSTAGVDTGSGASACTNRSSPCRTIGFAAGTMSGGDVLYLRNTGGSVYEEVLNNVFPAGTLSNRTLMTTDPADLTVNGRAWVR